MKECRYMHKDTYYLFIRALHVCIYIYIRMHEVTYIKTYVHVNVGI